MTMMMMMMMMMMGDAAVDHSPTATTRGEEDEVEGHEGEASWTAQCMTCVFSKGILHEDMGLKHYEPLNMMLECDIYWMSNANLMGFIDGFPMASR